MKVAKTGEVAVEAVLTTINYQRMIKCNLATVTACSHGLRILEIIRCHDQKSND